MLATEPSEGVWAGCKIWQCRWLWKDWPAPLPEHLGQSEQCSELLFTALLYPTGYRPTCITGHESPCVLQKLIGLLKISKCFPARLNSLIKSLYLFEWMIIYI